MAGSSIVAWVKFWMDQGKTQSDAVVAAAKVEFLQQQFNEYRVKVAETYATTREVSEAEGKLSQAISRVEEGIYKRLDAITQRLDVRGRE